MDRARTLRSALLEAVDIVQQQQQPDRSLIWGEVYESRRPDNNNNNNNNNMKSTTELIKEQLLLFHAQSQNESKCDKITYCACIDAAEIVLFMTDLVPRDEKLRFVRSKLMGLFIIVRNAASEMHKTLDKETSNKPIVFTIQPILVRLVPLLTQLQKHAIVEDSLTKVKLEEKYTAAFLNYLLKFKQKKIGFNELLVNEWLRQLAQQEGLSENKVGSISKTPIEEAVRLEKSLLSIVDSFTTKVSQNQTPIDLPESNLVETLKNSCEQQDANETTNSGPEQYTPVNCKHTRGQWDEDKCDCPSCVKVVKTYRPERSSEKEKIELHYDTSLNQLPKLPDDDKLFLRIESCTYMDIALNRMKRKRIREVAFYFLHFLVEHGNCKRDHIREFSIACILLASKQMDCAFRMNQITEDLKSLPVIDACDIETEISDDLVRTYEFQLLSLFGFDITFPANDPIEYISELKETLSLDDSICEMIVRGLKSESYMFSGLCLLQEPRLMAITTYYLLCTKKKDSSYNLKEKFAEALNISDYVVRKLADYMWSVRKRVLEGSLLNVSLSTLLDRIEKSLLRLHSLQVVDMKKSDERNLDGGVSIISPSNLSACSPQNCLSTDDSNEANKVDSSLRIDEIKDMTKLQKVPSNLENQVYLNHLPDRSKPTETTPCSSLVESQELSCRVMSGPQNSSFALENESCIDHLSDHVCRPTQNYFPTKNEESKWINLFKNNGNKLFLGGVYRLTTDDLRKFFTQFGPVERVKILAKTDVGFINMRTLGGAVKAYKYAHSRNFLIRILDTYMIRVQISTSNYGQCVNRAKESKHNHQESSRGGPNHRSFSRSDGDWNTSNLVQSRLHEAKPRELYESSEKGPFKQSNSHSGPPPGHRDSYRSGGNRKTPRSQPIENRSFSSYTSNLNDINRHEERRKCISGVTKPYEVPSQQDSSYNDASKRNSSGTDDGEVNENAEESASDRSIDENLFGSSNQCMEVKVAQSKVPLQSKESVDQNVRADGEVNESKIDSMIERIHHPSAEVGRSQKTVVKVEEGFKSQYSSETRESTSQELVVAKTVKNHNHLRSTCNMPDVGKYEKLEDEKVAIKNQNKQINNTSKKATDPKKCSVFNRKETDTSNSNNCISKNVEISGNHSELEDGEVPDVTHIFNTAKRKAFDQGQTKHVRDIRGDSTKRSLSLSPNKGARMQERRSDAGRQNFSCNRRGKRKYNHDDSNRNKRSNGGKGQEERGKKANRENERNQNKNNRYDRSKSGNPRRRWSR